VNLESAPLLRLASSGEIGAPAGLGSALKGPLARSRALQCLERAEVFCSFRATAQPLAAQLDPAHLEITASPVRPPPG